MNIIIRGEILHIILNDNPITKMLFSKIEDRNEHNVEVHLDKNGHIVSLIITDVKFDVVNIRNLIELIKEDLVRCDKNFPSDELEPIIHEIEKDNNIRFRTNKI
ncbi:MAG: hypothetical protein ACTSWR_03885 [Candidatus Helarchaeota archaeon]